MCMNLSWKLELRSLPSLPPPYKNLYLWSHHHAKGAWWLQVSEVESSVSVVAVFFFFINNLDILPSGTETLTFYIYIKHHKYSESDGHGGLGVWVSELKDAKFWIPLVIAVHSVIITCEHFCTHGPWVNLMGERRFKIGSGKLFFLYLPNYTVNVMFIVR